LLHQVRSFARVFGLIPVASMIFFATFDPMPWMYWSAAR